VISLTKEVIRLNSIVIFLGKQKAIKQGSEEMQVNYDKKE